jgi:G:T-mismatch repair DNA endonuclease (very short patch repair protein)
LPTANSEFWRTKIEKNVRRDEQVYAELRELG